jgi:hypothetical protein
MTCRSSGGIYLFVDMSGESLLKVFEKEDGNGNAMKCHQ